eukprot:Rmarinus@m.28821
MDSRTPKILSSRSHRACGNQNGPSGRRGHASAAAIQAHNARELRAGAAAGEGGWCGCLPRMLCKDAGGTEGRVRHRHPECAVPAEANQAPAQAARVLHHVITVGFLIMCSRVLRVTSVIILSIFLSLYYYYYYFVICFYSIQNFDTIFFSLFCAFPCKKLFIPPLYIIL